MCVCVFVEVLLKKERRAAAAQVFVVRVEGVTAFSLQNEREAKRTYIHLPISCSPSQSLAQFRRMKAR